MCVCVCLCTVCVWRRPWSKRICIYIPVSSFHIRTIQTVSGKFTSNIVLSTKPLNTLHCSMWETCVLFKPTRCVYKYILTQVFGMNTCLSRSSAAFLKASHTLVPKFAAVATYWCISCKCVCMFFLFMWTPENGVCQLVEALWNILRRVSLVDS